MENLSKIYSEFANELQFEDLPQQVVLQAKKSIMDLLGACLAGSLSEVAEAVFTYYSEIGGKPEASVIGRKMKVPAIHSAFLNGISAHALELDDGHRWSGLHPGSPIIPAALAAAELSEAKGRELICSIVVGYEIAIRIGKSINPSHVLRGFHPTGTVGAFGAAAAAGKLLYLDREKMANALGIAGLYAGGLLQVMDEGGMAKPFNPGKAASAGLFSAQMALRGVTGPEHILEGSKGFLRAMSDEIYSNSLAEGLGTLFEICNVYFKIHDCCRHIHPAIDALLEILNTTKIDPHRIQRILVETYSVAVNLCGHGLAPGSLRPADARFSIPTSLALVAFNGSCNADLFCDNELSRPEIHRLAQLIEVIASDKWNASYPKKRGASVSLWIDNMVQRHEVELARGEPEKPLSLSDLYGKFQTNASKILSKKRVQELRKRIMDLDTLPVSALSEFLEGN